MSIRKYQFQGLMAPVFTPFDENKNVNVNVIPKYAKYLIQNGIKGVLVNGTTGEGTTMTRAERSQVLLEWLKHKSDLEIMVQVGGTNLKDVVFLAGEAEENGVGAILCLPDLFFRPSNVNELINYLKIVSAAAPHTPLLYYHIPSFTGINLNMKELLERSSEIPTFAGIKFTDNDLSMGSSCVSDNLKFLSVFLGCDNLFLPALTLGFDSAISTTINLFPSFHKNILSCYARGLFQEASLQQQKLNHNILQITKYGSWVTSMKEAMRKLTGINVGPVRDPLVDVTFTYEDLNLKF